MKIYNVITNDRGAGVQVDSFASRDVAVSHAKDFLESVCPGYWEEWRGNPRAFIFIAYYGESEIFVVETTLNEQVA